MPMEQQEGLARLRAGLEEADPRLLDWEATCLRHVASLLDSLEVARTEWDSLAGRLDEVRVARTRAEEERAECAGEAERLRAELESVRRERDALAAAAGELETRNRELADLRERLEVLEPLEDRHEALRAELEQTRVRLRDAERAQEEARVGRERIESLERELEVSGARLETALRERDILAESRREAGLRDRDLKQVREQLASQQRLCERLRAESEENLLLVCELRTRINRREEERDEALRDGRRKVKKILGRMHAVLDEVGAPRGEEMSFGERIRRLVAGPEGRAPLDFDDPFDAFEGEVGAG